MTATPRPDRNAIKAVFFRAIELQPGERDAYLAEACGPDSEMRAEVASLLAAHEDGPPLLDVLPFEGAAPALSAALRDPDDGAIKLASGTRIGHYEVLEPLGSGGMADVYRAHDTKLDRPVALKFVLDTVSGRSEKVLREARAASALNHPNICMLFEVGEFEGQPYLAMEYIAGQPLNSRIPPDGFDVTTVLQYGMQIADALAHAHEHGVIHRDLKAANVVVTTQGRAKVLDFGVATRVATTAAGVKPTTLTEAGRLTGTLAYMAPELLRGGTADARSDIWSLGVLLYELAVGTRPFIGSTSFELTSAIMKDAPAPLAAKVPPDLEAVIVRCLARDPAHRFQRASDVVAALEGCNRSGGVRFSRRIPRRRAAVALLAAVVSALAAFGWYQRRDAAAELLAASIAVLPFTVLSGQPDIGFLGIGIPDTIISRITLVRSIRVRAVLAPGKEREDLQTTGGSLGVDYVLTGTIQQSGTDIRITPRLIRVADGITVWTNAYTLPSGNLLRLQDDIARNVVEALPVRMTSEDRARVDRQYTESPEAYAAYVRGREHLSRNDRATTLAAVEAFQAALNHDPDYVLAFAGLAVASARMALFYAKEDEVKTWQNGAHRAARRALDLGPDVAQTREALAAVSRSTEFAWEDAINESTRALELNPSLDQSHGFRASAFLHLGLLDRAATESQAAMDINPANLAEPLRVQGVAAMYDGRARDAVPLLEKASLESKAPVEWNRAYAYYYAGDSTKAEAMLRTLGKASSARSQRRAQATLASILAAGQRTAEADELVAAVRGGSYMDHHVAYSLGAAYAQLGRLDEAMTWLTAAKTTGFPCYPWFEGDPLLAPLRGTQAFQRFMDDFKQSFETKKAQLAALQ